MGPLVFADRALLVGGTLVVADLHVGRDARSDVTLPLGERGDLTDRLAALLDRFDPDRVVLAGDVLHSFSTVPDGVPETLGRVRGVARETGASIEAVRGNHDTMLSSVWDDPLDGAVRVDDWVVCHGHEPPALAGDGYVIGHVHPVIRIEGQRRPCFLRGTYEGSELVVVPAFTRFAPGTVINRLHASEFNSPLVTDADALRPVVVAPESGEAHEFPPLGEFRHML